ncbi:MAG: FAD:protein FMN transferase [Tissierellia bacterium]|nr:FAD:protein FMN transferase [Tissierellia bacterium]
MKKIILLLMILLSLVACSSEEPLDMYQGQFYECFDTVTSVSIPATSEEEAQEKIDKIQKRYEELHQLYDKYHEYPGIVNIKTINEKGHKEPVKVEKDLLDLLIFSKENYKNISKKVDISKGALLEVWSDYRDGHEAGLDFEGEEQRKDRKPELPPMEELEKVGSYGSMENLIIDEKNSTVFLKDPNMKLDVGAVAKGFATEIVARELEKQGEDHIILSAGGNVRLIGNPLDPNKKRFVIGLQNPEVLTDDGTGSNILDVVYANDVSIVSSGDYQRYYEVDGKIYHHIIDMETLYPGDYFRGVSVVTKDSGIADFLSTAVFLMPYEEGKALIDSLPDTEAYWIFDDMSVKYTDGMGPMLRSQGATN